MWVREMSTKHVHGLALRLMQESVLRDLSDAQEWLWRGCISELEYRHRRPPRGERPCCCELCIPPFPD